MSDKIIVPTLGESVTEATVSKWLKSQGEKVTADEPIVELETDKVNVEVPDTGEASSRHLKPTGADMSEVNPRVNISESESQGKERVREVDEVEDFDFNQDFEIEEGKRSPGWIRYQKRIK